MFLCKIISRSLSICSSLSFYSRARSFSVIYDKNFDYFRNREEYKNSVVQLNVDQKESKVDFSEFTFLLKERSVLAEEYFSYLNLRENVMKLSAAQVKEVLSFMAYIRIDTSKYATILNYLDQKCAISVERWPLDLLFFVLDAWFIIWGPKMYQKHYYTAITGLWGMSKVCPPFLMESIEDRMEKFVSDFSDVELAVACLSYFKTSKKINSDSLLKQSCQAAESLLSKNDRFNVISILKCLRLSKFYDEKLWGLLKEYTKREVSDFNFVECTNFLAVFANQNVYDEVLFNTLEEKGVEVLQLESDSFDKNKVGFDEKTHPSVRCRVKDIARFMWSLTSVGHCVKDDTLKFLDDVLKERMSMGEFESQTHVLIDCLQSFTLAGYYPHDILTSVMTPSTLKKLHYLDRAKPRYQLFFIRTSVQIEEPKLQFKIQSIYQPIPKKLERDLKERKGLQDIIDILNKTSIKSFAPCYLMPHIMISGIIVGEEGNSEKDFGAVKRLVDDRIISKQALDIYRNCGDLVCIELLDPTVCVHGSDLPLGLMKAKLRQLNTLNFKTVTLSVEQINILKQNTVTRSCKSIHELIELL